MLLLQKENQVNQIIPDDGGLMNTIKVSQSGSVAALKVQVNIEHPYIGDLKIDLISPSGKSITLHNREGGSQDNLDLVFEGDLVGDLIGEVANGDWILAIQDFAPRDEGSLKSWGLELRCEQEHSEIFIPEEKDAWLMSEQKCNIEGIIEDATLTVDIEHTYVGDLVVKLVSPDGTDIMLRDREGGSADDVKMTYDMETLGALKGKSTAGTWTLKIQDNADGDQGALKHWKLGFRFQKIDDLSKLDSLSPEDISALHAINVHSYSRLSTLGTTKIMETLGRNHVEANALLDVASAAAKGDFSVPEVAEEVAEEVETASE